MRARRRRRSQPDPHLGLMWGAIRMIDPVVESPSLELNRAAPSRSGGGSPDMRITRMAFCLLGLTSCCCAGCSSREWGLRSSSPSKLQTVASVGDKPLPIVAGEPGSSLRAETEEPELPRATGARISGRVYDDQGRAVPNARVRLVVDAAPGGKVRYATTDRSGAFTLRGLRPGASYTMIAESQGRDGRMSGRASARAPRSDVRIALEALDGGSDPPRGPIRPARARAATTPEDDAERAEDASLPEVGNPGITPVEDKEPPAEEAAARSPREDPRPSSRLAARMASAPIRAGWSVRQPA